MKAKKWKERDYDNYLQIITFPDKITIRDWKLYYIFREIFPTFLITNSSSTLKGRYYNYKISRKIEKYKILLYPLTHYESLESVAEVA